MARWPISRQVGNPPRSKHRNAVVSLLHPLRRLSTDPRANSVGPLGPLLARAVWPSCQISHHLRPFTLSRIRRAAHALHRTDMAACNRRPHPARRAIPSPLVPSGPGPFRVLHHSALFVRGRLPRPPAPAAQALGNLRRTSSSPKARVWRLSMASRSSMVMAVWAGPMGTRQRAMRA